VVRARDGDVAAWARLVDRYSGLLWSIARSYGLSQADAGDVVQTTWLRLVERIDRIERPGSVGTWLAVTARRESLHAARRASARGAALDEAVVPAPGNTAPEEIALARERVGQVAEALAALPRRCQVLLRLCAAAPSYAELATALGMPVGSIGPTRARCLEGLLERLAR
jgi:RNA polymerase sigma factor (sigma-70 family)